MMKDKPGCCAATRNSVQESTKAPTTSEGMTQSDPVIDKEMVKIDGGTFRMGTTDRDANKLDGETPIHEVTVDSYYMDRTAVTNKEFNQFVQATGYKTEAEDYGWSFVFYLFISEATAKKVKQYPPQTPWWFVVEGATWKTPEGSDSTIEDRMDHPVVHISWNDAAAYAKWACKRLPTEAEWEFAARGGLNQKRYPWGDGLTPNGEHQCNIWQGEFPKRNDQLDGYVGTAPVTAFKPNGYGLYNMVGNVWEWCGDWFTTNFELRGGSTNPKGAKSGSNRVMRGGSYLCHDSYCNRYRVAARTSNTPDSSTGNIGFRCVKDIY